MSGLTPEDQPRPAAGTDPRPPPAEDEPVVPAEPEPPKSSAEGEPADGQTGPGQDPAGQDEPGHVTRDKATSLRPPLDLPGPPDPADEWISLLTADPADE